jgi:hypothetical protein
LAAVATVVEGVVVKRGVACDLLVQEKVAT